jgi:hypothetical protein
MNDTSIKDNLIDALAEMVAEKVGGYKHDLPAGFTTTTNFMHGPTGIFGAAGLDQNVFGTRIKPRGLLSVLPSMPSIDASPIVSYLTGFTDESGSEPSAPCAECVKAGEIKSCYQGSAFGLVCRETDEMVLANIGKRNNRSEFYDLRLVNDPLLNNAEMWVPSSVPKSTQDVLNREVLARWLTLGVAFENKLCQLVWTGNPANNVGSGYAEYDGLERLVKTGHVDVLTSTSCPSLDSDIKDANYLSVENDSAQIFYLMEMIYRFVKHNAQHMGFMPVQWAWVMKDALFRQLTDRWPCVYASARCNATNNDIVNNVDGLERKRMADEMYIGQFLQIDGVRIPVILDDCIPYESNETNGDLDSTEHASDIYLIPFTVRGGTPVTFMEYFDYSTPTIGTMQGIADGRMGHEYWTDGGRFLWSYNRTRFCASWVARIEPRLRLLTPHLAGRLENVKFAPIQMFREPLPSQGYFVDGGETYRSNAPY